MARILVVDDEPDIQTLLRLYLEMNGHTVITADDGAEALDRALQHLPDLVLLDVMLPKVDGKEVLRQLKGDPNTSSTPIVLMSASSENLQVREGETAADAYMEKPFTLEDVVSHVSALL